MLRGATGIALSLFILLIVGLVWALKTFGIDLTQLTPERLRDAILSFGIYAPLVYLAVYGQPLVPLPATVMTLAAGMAFGALWGFGAALLGASIRACSEFAVARYLGRDLIVKLFKAPMAKLNPIMGAHGFSTVLLIRLIPNFPFDIQNFGLGISQVRFIPYALATIIGIAPMCFAYVYLGDSLTDLRQLWKLGLAILAIAVLVISQRLFRGRS